MPRQRESRAIATIIGGVLLAIALLTILALYYYLNAQQKIILNTLGQAIREKTTIQLLASSIEGYYTYRNSSLIITVVSRAPRAVAITSINILWSNQTLLSIDRYRTINATLATTSGTATTITRLPVTIAPGDILKIVINNSTQPITITASISTHIATAIIVLKPS